jgi:hypothetical protein
MGKSVIEKKITEHAQQGGWLFFTSQIEYVEGS